ncbi:MAG TPA: proton-conducting transporter membrane subunit [Candidatus Fermentibacter daniensis]|nr:proton-conducting transporter membrane subunit [Candidatus Fermentibacter daniensis]
MVLFGASLVVLFVSGIAAMLNSGRHPGRAAILGVSGAVTGAALAIASAVPVLAGAPSWQAWTLWQTPLGPMNIALDQLSAIFAILISTVTALAAIYGRGYLSGHGTDPRAAGRSWCWFNLLLASMLLVVFAADGLTFLIGWESMSLASFFLVLFDHEHPGVTRAGWIYLITTHIGAAFLFVMFMLAGNGTSLDFFSINVAGNLRADQTLANTIFLLALAGFGTKAGLVPTHIWLPEAHPAAPSHVSAVMSGVMIKTGIYGLFRIISMIGAPPLWWGWTLVVIGSASGILGVLFALAQHDLKRLLAYHSIENIGIIVLGMGIGLVGSATGNHLVAMLGYAGAILHTLNHGVFKSLLFMGAGSVIHATGSRDIDRLGGLMKRMPVTGATFLTGAAAISGLPGLNGFMSEFLIYAGAFMLIVSGGAIWAGVVTALSLAIIGGLALACFTKAAGAVFLGEPRGPAPANATESPRAMLGPMITLAVFCVGLALGAPWLAKMAGTATGMAATAASFPDSLQVFNLLADITVATVLLVLLVLAAALLRSHVLKGRASTVSPTWDCGYAAASPRVQYSASSFADPIVRMFRIVLRTRRHVQAPEGFFPTAASLETHTDDVLMARVFEPAARGVTRLASLVSRLQQGSTHLYLMYIFVTIIILMIWNLR